eukprot:6172928-Amphidinium_carterae.1
MAAARSHAFPLARRMDVVDNLCLVTLPRATIESHLLPAFRALLLPEGRCLHTSCVSVVLCEEFKMCMPKDCFARLLGQSYLPTAQRIGQSSITHLHSLCSPKP